MVVEEDEWVHVKTIKMAAEVDGHIRRHWRWHRQQQKTMETVEAAGDCNGRR